MVRRISKCLATACLVLASVALTPTTALAANQEPAGLNLGLTSFFDGFGPSAAGFTYQAYLAYSAANAIYDGEGNKIDVFRDPRISTFVLVNQLTYALPDTLFDGAVRPAFNFILPAVLFDTSFGSPGPALSDNGIGLGDLIVGSTWQFTPIMVEGHPVFSHRFEVDLMVPTGRYDPHKNLNQGTNFLSINPYWAGTFVPAKGLELSVRLHYLFNARNDRPTNTPMGLLVDSAQAGQLVWGNFAASYEIVDGLHLGANGYYLKQLTADEYHLVDGTRTDGGVLGEGKEQVLGIGPGVLWQASRSDMLFANLYFQALVQARAGATVFNLRWLHSF